MCETTFAACIVLIPNAPLELIIITVQVFSGNGSPSSPSVSELTPE